MIHQSSPPLVDQFFAARSHNGGWEGQGGWHGEERVQKRFAIASSESVVVPLLYILTRKISCIKASPNSKNQMVSQVFDVSITPFLAAIGRNDNTSTLDVCKAN
jgi:hypothetical protein